jgi:hypothetical protein
MTVSFATIPVPGFSIQNVANSFMNSISQTANDLQASINAVTPGDPNPC